MPKENTKRKEALALLKDGCDIDYVASTVHEEPEIIQEWQRNSGRGMRATKRASSDHNSVYVLRDANVRMVNEIMKEWGRRSSQALRGLGAPGLT